MMERRLIRETSFGLTNKLWQVSWLYVLLLCALAAVGYVALYSAAGGSAEPYASRHLLRFAFGVGLMLSIALVDIRFIAKPGVARLRGLRCSCWCWSRAWAMSARARSAGSTSPGCSSSPAS